MTLARFPFISEIVLLIPKNSDLILKPLRSPINEIIFEKIICHIMENVYAN